LYLLHGVPGRPDDFLNIGDAAVAEEVLVAERRMRPLILVIATGSPSLLADEEWADGVRPWNQWETFVARDLVDAVDRRYRTIASGAGERRLSEGRYGALSIGLHHPGEFRVLESWSGYMRAPDLAAVFGFDPSRHRYNSPAAFVAEVARTLRDDRVFIWFYCGSGD
jgi:S-formylglutathione hydrolase FrmB